MVSSRRNRHCTSARSSANRCLITSTLSSETSRSSEQSELHPKTPCGRTYSKTRLRIRKRRFAISVWVRISILRETPWDGDRLPLRARCSAWQYAIPCCPGLGKSKFGAEFEFRVARYCKCPCTRPGWAVLIGLHSPALLEERAPVRGTRVRPQTYLASVGRRSSSSLS